MTTTLPSAFCWTKFGTEAGEPIERIFARKEAERQANGGVFLWGIGNSIGPSLASLVQEINSPEILFSPMLTKPAAHDVAPTCIAKWSSAVGLGGQAYSIPAHTLVTSRFSADRRHHFALVCHSETPLQPSVGDVLSADGLRNLVRQTPVGASQVTSVVTYDPSNAHGRHYSVAMRARLVAPYFVTLSEPIVCKA